MPSRCAGLPGTRSGQTRSGERSRLTVDASGKIVAAMLAQLLAEVKPVDVVGKDIVIGMLIVGLVFLGVIILGELSKVLAHRRRRG